MKYLYLYFVFLATAVHGGIGRVRRQAKVPAPHIKRVTVKDPPGFLVQWEPVKSDGEPVLGYKLKVKEIKGENSQHSTSNNHEKDEDTDLDALIDEVFNSKLEDIDIKGADNTEALFTGAKLDTWYELRVVAYTKSEESEESAPEELKINSPKTEATTKKQEFIVADPPLDAESLIDIRG